MMKRLASYLALSVLCVITFVQATPQIQNLDMQGYKIQRLGAAVAASDAVRLDQIPTPLPTATPGTAPTAIPGTGLVAQTAANTFVTRTLTGPAAGITVSNGDGVAGNPTLALANDLSAVEGLSSTGIAVRTAANTWAERSLGADSNNIDISNDNGVSAANIGVDLSSRYRAGWTDIPNTETWQYASATTITVPSDGTTRYAVGDKLYLIQSATDKYFYVVGVAATTLTITGGTNYTLTNVSITSPQYSKEESPVGFPGWFNWTPTLTGFSADPTNTAYRFKIEGRKCTVMVAQTTNGTSNATGFTITAPVTAATVTNGSWGTPSTIIVDNTAIPTTPGLVWLQSASNSIVLYKDMALGAWTNSGGKRAYFTLDYEI